MPVPKAKTSVALTDLDLSFVDNRVLVVMATSILALALRHSSYQYTPALRVTHAKWLLRNIPKVLDKIAGLRRGLLLEFGGLLRVGGDRYLKQAARELTVWLTKG